MKKIFLLVFGSLCITAVVYIVLKFMWSPGGWQENLVSPGFGFSKAQTVLQTPTPKPTPRTFKFDENTDLNLELEKVNPQVSDEDFF